MIVENTDDTITIITESGGVLIPAMPPTPGCYNFCYSGVTGLWQRLSEQQQIVKSASTIMRTPTTISLLPAQSGTINIVGGNTTARGSVQISGTNATYTPNIRIPRWPEVTAYDGFGYTGLDSSGNVVIGQVNVKISAVTPDNHYIITDTGARTTIYGVNLAGAGGITQTVLATNAGENALASNNVDGVVLSSPGGNNIGFWDPVSGATGLINISNILGFAGTIDVSSAGTFDNDKVEFWIFNDTPGGVGEVTTWFYRIYFEPYITGTVPVPTVIRRGRVYANFALTTPYLPASTTYGDAAWDPQSGRIYLIGSGGDLGYITPYEIRFDASQSVAYQRFAQGTVTPGQMTMTWDGKALIGQTSGGVAVYRINRVPATATQTSLGNVIGGVNCLDCAPWPSTLAIPNF
jgi:hypothetical protein